VADVVGIDGASLFELCPLPCPLISWEGERVG